MRPNVTIHLSENKTGRDFIIGDLHGCYQQLMEKLSEVKFDVSIDRLFSVGDLIDRGPESLECLRLLSESWFFAVRGNHESMLLNYLGIERAMLSSPRDFIDNGGDWVLRLSSTEKAELMQIVLQKVRFMPYQVFVKDTLLPFYVTHSGHGILGERISSPDEVDNLSEYELEQLLWERDFLKSALSDLGSLAVKTKMASYLLSRNTLELDHNPVHLKTKTRLSHLVYAGHNSLRIPILAQDHFFIDTGCGKSGRLTLIEHRRLLGNNTGVA